MKSLTRPLRTRFAEDIIAEVTVPIKQTGRILILLGGAPSLPSKPEVMDFWTKKGYVCILPRLRGTWESGGEFLKESPEVDISDILHEITSKNFTGIKILEEPYLEKTQKILVRSIYIIGASFGGTGAVLASRHQEVKKVIALAPVLDWSVESPEEPFDFFQRFTIFAFGEAYRAKKNSWQKLYQNKLYSPIIVSTTLPGEKILILHSQDDTVVPIEPLYSFIRDTNCSFKEYKKGGHFGLSDSMNTKYYREIENFLNSK